MNLEVYILKVTLGQFEPIIGDKHHNLTQMRKILERASFQNSDIVLFPELCLTGYFIQDLDVELAETTDGPSLHYIKNICKELQLHTVFSWAELGEAGIIYNTSCIINHKGEMIGKYRKVHLYDREKEIFSPGESFKVFETIFGKIGIMICYDLDFPESARILNLKNADIILIPTNNFYPYERYQKSYLRSRSMENEIPVAICNRTGQEQNLKYFGESAVYDAHGYQLLELNHLDNTKTVEVSLTKEKDDKLSYKQNRIPSAYTELKLEDIK